METEVPDVAMWPIYLALSLYFIPFIIAGLRRHQSWMAVGALNVFLGWTFLGWIAALVWSLTGVKPKPAHKPEKDTSNHHP